MSKYLTFSLIIVSFVIGTGAGYAFSPNYKMQAYETNQMSDLGKPDKYVDLRYINAMIAHHTLAIRIAEQAKSNSKRTEVVNLANDIITNEPKAIQELYDWKKEWFNDTRKVAEKAVPNLGTYDESFDLRFLNALITHHQEGIEMTKEIQLKSTKQEIINNSDAVYTFLSNGVSMLKEWRKNWYNK